MTASTYEYCYDNPVRFTDPTGEQVPPQDGELIKKVEKKEDPNDQKGAWYPASDGTYVYDKTKSVNEYKKEHPDSYAFREMHSSYGEGTNVHTTFEYTSDGNIFKKVTDDTKAKPKVADKNIEQAGNYNTGGSSTENKQQGNPVLEGAKDFTDNIGKSTLVPSGAFDFVSKTKTGRWLSMGGNTFSRQSYTAQKAIINSWNTASKFAKPLTRSLAVINFVATSTAIVNDFSKGEYKSASARTAVWGIAAGASFIPVAGWGIALGIGVADAIWGDDFYKYIEKNW